MKRPLMAATLMTMAVASVSPKAHAISCGGTFAGSAAATVTIRQSEPAFIVPDSMLGRISDPIFSLDSNRGEIASALLAPRGKVIDPARVFLKLRDGRVVETTSAYGLDDVRISKNGKSVLISSQDRSQVLHFDSSTKSLRKVDVNRANGMQAEISDDGSFIVIALNQYSNWSSSQPKAAAVVDAKTGALSHVIEAPTRQTSDSAIAISPDNQRVVLSPDEFTLAVYPVSTRSMADTRAIRLEGRQSKPDQIIFTADGHTVIAGSGYDGIISYWSSSTGQLLGKSEQLQHSRITGMKPIQDGKYLAVSQISGWIHVINNTNGKIVASTRIPESAGQLFAISVDGTTVLAGTSLGGGLKYELDFIGQ